MTTMLAKIEGDGWVAQLDESGNWRSNNLAVQIKLQLYCRPKEFGPSWGNPIAAAATQAVKTVGGKVVHLQVEEAKEGVIY